MKKLSKIVAVILAIVSIATIFAACGGNKDTQKVKVVDIKLTEEQYAFGVDKNQPELLEQVNAIIDEIMENGKFDEICSAYFGDGEKHGVKSAELDSSKEQLVVATNAAFEPFEYMDGELYYGIDMEIAAVIAEKLGKELVINNMNFDAVCLSVGQHKCDIAMAGLTVKPDREAQVTFTKSYYNASQKIVVAGDDTTFDECKTVEDVEAILKGLDNTVIIGGQTGTTGQFYVEGDADWGFDGLATQWKGYTAGSLAVQDLINGNIKYVIIDEAPATAIVTSINELA